MLDLQSLICVLPISSFALLEMRLVTCRLLLEFDMQLPEKSLDWRNVIKTPMLWDKKALWMSLK